MGPNAANVDGAYLIGHIFWQKTLIDSKSDLGLLETRVLEESSVTFDTSIMSWSTNLSSVIFTFWGIIHFFWFCHNLDLNKRSVSFRRYIRLLTVSN